MTPTYYLDFTMHNYNDGNTDDISPAILNSPIRYSKNKNLYKQMLHVIPMVDEYDSTHIYPRIKVPQSIVQQSGLLKTMIDDDDPNSLDDVILPLPHAKLNLNVLDLVIEFTNMYELHPILHKPDQPLIHNQFTYMLTKPNDTLNPDMLPYVEFFKGLTNEFKDRLGKISDVIIWADYLNIPPLFEWCCAKFACMFKDRNEIEIKKLLNLPSDFVMTEEDKAAIKAHYPWVVDNDDQNLEEKSPT